VTLERITKPDCVRTPSQGQTQSLQSVIVMLERDYSGVSTGGDEGTRPSEFGEERTPMYLSFPRFHSVNNGNTFGKRWNDSILKRLMTLGLYKVHKQ
jgi:hypothetical protein